MTVCKFTKMLATYVTQNGYDVWLQSSEKGSVLGILNDMADRESVFGYDQETQPEVFRQIANQFCTQEQILEMEAAGFMSFMTNLVAKT